MPDSAQLARWAPYALGLLRIVAGLLFLEHGTQKLLGFPDGDYAFAQMGSIFWWSGLIELVTGVLLVLGLFTRPAAFIASGEMAVAYWMMHAPQSFFPINNGGDASILYCFLFLYLVFAGPGALSLDRRGRTTAT
jgi:putative oxidoreductase